MNSKELGELQAEYNTKDGIITNPGKFEGETLYTPFCYDLMLNGEGDIIKIQPEDRVNFEIDDRWTHVVVIENCDGFVSLGWFDSFEDATDEANKQFIDNNDNIDYLFD